ncbi:unnamed protein product [Didymodactylos carnosus]|uniref:Uncharacterized protein n=1 Tax=Didymodactylos carnosus TaxID=1234261 RepID=A0A816AG79_9BILA|nr:unnamed protein product [Didymodactylos carnosus]CAF4472281.1 unnamed protein product [Didymodactylos carnosus]
MMLPKRSTMLVPFQCFSLLIVSVALLMRTANSCMSEEDKVQIPAIDKQYLMEQLAAQGMNEEDAQNTIAELQNFYSGIKLGMKNTPTVVVDTAWHAHIINTQMYFDFTENVFGRYLHHKPRWSGSVASELPMQDAYSDLLALGFKNLNKTIWFSDTVVPLTPYSEVYERSLEQCEL